MQSSVVEHGIKARYIGQNVGARLIKGNDDRVYRGGNNRLDRIQYLHPDDVGLLKDVFEVVDSPAYTYERTVSSDGAILQSYTHKGAMIVNNTNPISTFDAERFNVSKDAADLNPESIGASDEQADQPRKRNAK